MDQYPGNSRSKKIQPEPQDDKKVSKIIAGEPIRRKKTLSRRFIETFISGEDARSVFGDLFAEVFVPAAKETVSEMASQGIDRMLFGESRGGRSIRSRAANNALTSSIVSYNRISSGQRREDPRREIDRRKRAIHNFDDIILETRVEAQETIDKLFEIISSYDSASVSDLYEMCGITGEYTDEKWGWTDLRGARPVRVRGGYLLDLPKPELLD